MSEEVKGKKCKKESVVSSASAPKVEQVEEESAPENIPITEECTMNLSLFDVAAKQKNYADAYEPWKQVFDNCHRTILPLPYRYRSHCTYSDDPHMRLLL